MRYTVLTVALATALLAACGKDPAVIVQPGVPVGQAPVQVQDPQYQQPQQPQYQQAPQVVQAAPPTVIVQQPQVVQQPVVVHDNSGASLVTGMALGAMIAGNNGASREVVRERTTIINNGPTAAPYSAPYQPNVQAVAPRGADIRTAVAPTPPVPAKPIVVAAAPTPPVAKAAPAVAPAPKPKAAPTVVSRPAPTPPSGKR